MIRLILLSFITLIVMNSALQAAENENRDLEHSFRDVVGDTIQVQETEVSIVNKFKKMFKEGEISGNIRSMYSSFDNKWSSDTYAAAIGGGLKYELAQFNGFNAGVAFRSTYDIDFLSGKSDKKMKTYQEQKCIIHD